jgi:hypothetical protein
VTTSIAIQATRRATSTTCADLTESLLFEIKRKRQHDLTNTIQQTDNASPIELAQRLPRRPSDEEGKKNRQRRRQRQHKPRLLQPPRVQWTANNPPHRVISKRSHGLSPTSSFQTPERTSFLKPLTYVLPENSHAAARAARGLTVDHRMRLPNDSGIFEPPSHQALQYTMHGDLVVTGSSQSCFGESPSRASLFLCIGKTPNH